MTTTELWRATLFAVALCGIVGTDVHAAPGASDAADEAAVPVAVADYTVFVDPPTGFVFVKLPQGWQFVGRVQQSAQAGLPAHVRTTLLTAAPARASAVDGTQGAPSLAAGR